MTTPGYDDIVLTVGTQDRVALALTTETPAIRPAARDRAVILVNVRSASTITVDATCEAH